MLPIFGYSSIPFMDVYNIQHFEDERQDILFVSVNIKKVYKAYLTRTFLTWLSIPDLKCRVDVTLLVHHLWTSITRYTRLGWHRCYVIYYHGTHSLFCKLRQTV